MDLLMLTFDPDMTIVIKPGPLSGTYTVHEIIGDEIRDALEAEIEQRASAELLDRDQALHDVTMMSDGPPQKVGTNVSLYFRKSSTVDPGFWHGTITARKTI